MKTERRCADCIHASTPKGKQCYTLTRVLNEKVRDKGLPFYPEIFIPILDKLGEDCKRYKERKEEGMEGVIK